MSWNRPFRFRRRRRTTALGYWSSPWLLDRPSRSSRAPRPETSNRPPNHPRPNRPRRNRPEPRPRLPSRRPGPPRHPAPEAAPSSCKQPRQPERRTARRSTKTTTNAPFDSVPLPCCQHLSAERLDRPQPVLTAHSELTSSTVTTLGCARAYGASNSVSGAVAIAGSPNVGAPAICASVSNRSPCVRFTYCKYWPWRSAPPRLPTSTTGMS